MAILASENIRTAAAVTAMDRIGYATLVGSASGGGVAATTWFGDASDGNLLISAGTTHSEPVTLDEGWIFKQYNNLTIEEGGIWQPANRCNGTIICVYGDLTVDGTISADAKSPLVNDKEVEFLALPWVKLPGVSAGGNGGDGGAGKKSGADTEYYTEKVGSGGLGGAGHALGGGNGGGGGAGILHGKEDTTGYTFTAQSGTSGVRAPIGTIIPYPVTTGNAYGTGGSARASAKSSSYTSVVSKGGDGPGGGGATLFDTAAGVNAGTPTEGKDGAAIGGGGLWIYVRGRVSIGSTGLISANGGPGGAGVAKGNGSRTATAGGGGGGGGGGIVVVVHSGDYTNNGTVEASGGLGGAAGKASSYITGNAGGNGGVGKVLVTVINELLPAA